MVQTKLTGTADKKLEVAEELAKKQREISISEFFTKNRHLLGFDNPRKALLTTIKEAVDNSLDAAEEMRVLPDLKIEINQLKQEDRFEVIVEDNGPGIVKEQVPRIFAKLLYGSKFFSLKCSRGQQGIGICMSPDTLVPLANGDIKEIKDIVDSGIKENAFVLRPDLKLSKQRIGSFFKIKAPSRIVKLNVLGGKKIELSPENPVLIKTEHGLDWKRADCLCKGEYVAVAKKLTVYQHTEEPFLLSVINTDGLRLDNPQFTAEIIKKLRKKYGSFGKIAEKFGIKKDQIRGFTKKPLMRNPELKLLLRFAIDISYKREEVYAKAIRVGRLGNYTNIPTKLCPQLFRFAGLIAGDGNIQKKRDDRWGQTITFWNNETNLLYDFKRLTKELFGVNTEIIKDKRGRGNYVHFSSAVVADLLEKMGVPAGNKSRTFRIHPLLLKSSDEHLAEYVRALFDAEGSVSEKRRNITLMLTNEYVLRCINMLLLRFGIHSTINKARDNKRIVISGKDNIMLFKEKIGFLSQKQSRKLNSIIKQSIRPNPQLMVYPKMGRCIINAEKALGMSHYSLKCNQAKTSLLQKKYLSHNTLSRIFSTFMTNSSKKLPSELQEIYALLNSDIGWSKVTNVEFTKPEYDYVYDITMGRGNNFVANNVIIHNSAAAMYGQLTTGKPIRITTKIGPKRKAYYCELHIDTKINEPKILKEEETEWEKKEHGTKIELELEAKYQKGKGSIEDYLKQTAIANPHASITYKDPEGQVMEFPRATKELPKEPREIKPHPYGIELGILIKMLGDTRSNTLKGFLQSDFCRVSPKIAKEICEKAKLYENARPSRIARQEADNLMQAIRTTKIMAPPTDCVTPIGEENLIKGLKKEVSAEFYAATTRPPSVYRGNPFVVEAAIAYGGTLPADDLVRVIRFANRVPLLFQQSACAITKSIIQTAWKNYGVSQSKGALPSGPAVIMVHMASVWVPFTSESKEAVATYPEIAKEIKLALQESGRQLAAYVRKVRKVEHEKERKKIFEMYIKEVATSLHSINRCDREKVEKDLLKIAQKRTLGVEQNE